MLNMTTKPYPSAESMQDNSQLLSNSRTIKRSTPHAFEGDLAILTIDNLMHLLSHAYLSGELHVIGHDNSACFIIDNGSLVFSSIKYNPLKIGKRLLDKECISLDDLQQCMTLYRTHKRKVKFGSLLVERGVIDRHTLEQTVREQIRDIFFEALSWEQGHFYFVPEKENYSGDITLDERIDHLLLEGLIHLDNGGLEN